VSERAIDVSVPQNSNLLKIHDRLWWFIDYSTYFDIHLANSCHHSAWKELSIFLTNKVRILLP
jgi:hypothetical protein